VILLPLGRWILLLLLKAFLSRLIRLLRNRRKSIIKNLCCSASLATLIREKCFFFIFCFSRSQFNVFLVLFSLPLLHLKEFSLFLGWELKVLLVLAAWVRVGFLCFIFCISFFFGPWQRIARQRKKCNKFYYARCQMSISFNDFSPWQRQLPPVDRRPLFMCLW